MKANLIFDISDENEKRNHLKALHSKELFEIVYWMKHQLPKYMDQFNMTTTTVNPTYPMGLSQLAQEAIIAKINEVIDELPISLDSMK